MNEKIVIFGAGKFGHLALNQYNAKNVKYFIDNNETLVGESIEGIPIRKVEDILYDIDDFVVIIASASYESMEKQLIELGFHKYKVFKDDSDRYYPTDKLIFDPYKNNIQRKFSENDWIESLRENKTIQAINSQTELLYFSNKLFEHVEIETINRCNGTCDFCPVSKNNDSRKYAIMDRKLYESIISQLAEIDYSGRLALFSNNEPFLDEDIIDKHKYAREKLPKAKMHLYTMVHY